MASAARERTRLRRTIRSSMAEGGGGGGGGGVPFKRDPKDKGAGPPCHGHPHAVDDTNASTQPMGRQNSPWRRKGGENHGGGDDFVGSSSYTMRAFQCHNDTPRKGGDDAYRREYNSEGRVTGGMGEDSTSTRLVAPLEVCHAPSRRRQCSIDVLF